MACEPSNKKARHAADDQVHSQPDVVSGVCYICTEPGAPKLNCACRGGGTEFAHFECIAQFNIFRKEQQNVSSFERIRQWKCCHICLQEFNGEEVLALSGLWMKHCQESFSGPFDLPLLEAKCLRSEGKVLLGDFVCAEKILIEVKVKIMQSGLTFGPFWYSVMNRLSFCAMRLKKYEKSEKIERDMLQTFQAKCPEEKDKIRNILHNIAHIQFKKGDNEVALKSVNEILEEIEEKNVQGEPRFKAKILKNLILVDMGDFTSAIDSMRSEIPNVIIVFGEQHRQVEYQMFLLARGLFLASRYQECAAVATEALEANKKNPSSMRQYHEKFENFLEKSKSMSKV
tara:strand:- start:502 stop:1530 length:1029 start_codon:yes stop_codon:yes gene_type:complete